jgi:hypothetical protein
MHVKAQKPNLRSEKIQSASFLLWIISGLYLLTMVWFLLLSPMGGYGPHEAQPGSCQQLSCSLFHMAFSCCCFGRMK